MRVAALDLGSNTFLCLIAEVEKNAIKSILSDQVEMVRLGQGLSNSKRFHPDALERADKTLEKFSQTIAEFKPEKILAMATSAARDAENKEDLFALGRKHGIPIEIIPGEREAEITYQGSTSGLEDTQQELMVLDIGGGSTEFIFGRGRTLIRGRSLDIGCVRLTEKFIKAQPTPSEQIKAVETFVENELKKIDEIMPSDFQVKQIVAVAGTPTTLAAAEIGGFVPAKIDGFVFTYEALDAWLNKLAQSSVEDKIKLGIPAGRADVILIGVIILLRTLKKMGQTQLTVSTRGVRYGVALEMARRFIS
ncbi:MAG: hypothetical protein K0R29_427 [Pseudobdellovibrio sp.]|jgi:exopolyphosphatase/guanosine-5'-triphosphate,3'-diphosphate pyrophosphatase|nr:hypothetical protein [Pseudobdellovibrio sp.]